MNSKLQHSMFIQFLKHPFSTGAVCASSSALCGKMIGCPCFREAKTIAELGAGTGAVTACILSSLPQGVDFFTVELNPEVIPLLEKRFPGLAIYNESAEHLRRILDERNIKSLDMVISSLPWAIFPDQLQRDILSGVCHALRPGGSFLTFAYLQGVCLPAGRRFRNLLQSSFSRVENSSVVWRNLPPAFIYRCTL